MYIRASQQKSPTTGKRYTTYRLVDTYRDSRGKVRQQLILNLGANFQIQKNQWKLLADRIEELLTGQATLLSLEPFLEKQAQNYAKRAREKYDQLQKARYASPSISKALPDHDYQCVDVNTVEHTELRHVGVVALGVHAADQLQLPELLENIGFNLRHPLSLNYSYNSG